MFLFFFGEDAFRIREKRLALKKLFFEKNPESTGFFEFDFSDGVEAKEFVASLSQVGLFAPKVFAIARNVFDAPIETRRNLAEFFERDGEALASDPNRVLLVAESGTPKKNEKLWKALSAKCVRREEFALPSGAALSRFMDEEAKASGAAGIDTNAKKLLSEICLAEAKKSGEKRQIDCFRLSSEIAKLGAYRSGEIIRAEDVRLLSPSAPSEESVFQVLDLVFAGRKEEAIRQFGALLRKGDVLGILALLAWQARSVARVAHVRADGSARTAFEAARLLKLQPFVAEKSFRIAARHSPTSLAALFARLAVLDRESKSGDRDPEEAVIQFVTGMSN